MSSTGAKERYSSSPGMLLEWMAKVLLQSSLLGNDRAYPGVPKRENGSPVIPGDSKTRINRDPQGPWGFKKESGDWD